MGLRDLARESFVFLLPLFAGAMPAVREQTRLHARARARAKVSSFLGPFFLGERDPFSLFNLPDQRAPGLGLRIECELVGQFAVSKLEFNRRRFVACRAGGRSRTG